MGGLKGEVDSIFLDKMSVAYRAPALYTQVGSPHVIFTITGGPVWVKAIFGRCTQVVAAGSTFAATLCGIAMQNAAVAIAGAVNTLIVWPLGAAATQVIIPALLAQPVPTLATAILGQTGQMASLGTFALTVAAADTDGLIEFYMVYQRMNRVSRVA